MSRRVLLGPGAPAAHFAGNAITTSKYNILTFVPIFLFVMFSRVAYLYFLLQARPPARTACGCRAGLGCAAGPARGGLAGADVRGRRHADAPRCPAPGCQRGRRALPCGQAGRGASRQCRGRQCLRSCWDAAGCAMQASLAWWAVVSPFTPYGPTIALVFVLLVAAIKAAAEDRKRHAEDRRTNNSIAHVVQADGAHPMGHARTVPSW